MKKISDVTSTADKNGEWTNGNVAAGIPPTVLESGWLNSVQREILGVLTKAGIPQDKNNDNQLSEAISKIITGGNYATAEDLKKKLTKDQNGADIPDKPKFIENLGLGEAAKSGLKQKTGTSTTDVMSQNAITNALKTAVNIDTIYPVGVVIWFAQNKNPNNLFPGTEWSYIGENKTIRLASSSGNNVLSSGGSDNVTLTTDHLPSHSHSFSGTTSNFDYGTKTTNSAGEHNHSVWSDISGDAGGGPVSLSRDQTPIGVSGAGRAAGYITHSKPGNQIISNAGNHSHTVSIGYHGHTFSGTTGNSGSGSSVSVVNAYIMLMGWYRTA